MKPVIYRKAKISKIKERFVNLISKKINKSEPEKKREIQERKEVIDHFTGSDYDWHPSESL